MVVKNPQRQGERDDFAAFAKLDLGKAAYYLPILSASTEQLELFDEIWKEGMKPEEWIDTILNVPTVELNKMKKQYLAATLICFSANALAIAEG
jgi:hypothetical protein